MPASNSGCEHLYLDGARASAWRSLSAPPRASTIGCGVVNDAPVRAERDHTIVAQLPALSIWVARTTQCPNPDTPGGTANWMLSAYRMGRWTLRPTATCVLSRASRAAVVLTFDRCRSDVLEAVRLDARGLPISIRAHPVRADGQTTLAAGVSIDERRDERKVGGP
jgi:hypothetical protein